MLTKRLLRVLTAGSLILALAAGSALAQAASLAPGSPAAPKAAPEYTLHGKIAYMAAEGGYYVQRHDNSREVYTIANQNPEVLAPLAKSGRIVTIEASGLGDMLTIHKIDGQPYQGTQKPVFK